MIKKINGKYFKYRNVREGNYIRTIYLGKANWFDIFWRKFDTLISNMGLK
jgi:hypothetical protein